MFLLTPFFAAISFMKSESAPHQIVAGLLWGMMLGLSPSLTLQWALLLLGLVVLRLNLFAVTGAFLFFSLAYLALEPGFHALGLYLLTQVPSLQRAWAWMFHAPILPYTRFNNTVVMGSLVFITVAFVPAFLLFHNLVYKHSKQIVRRYHESFIWRMWVSSRLYRRYGQYQTR